MSVPGSRKARPAPAVTERAWADADGSRAVATAPLSGTSSGQTGPSEHRSFRCVPVPLPVPAGSSVSPLEPLGRTAVDLAAGTGCRIVRLMTLKGTQTRTRPVSCWFACDYSSVR